MSDISLSNQHLATLYEITRKLNSTLDISEVLNYVMDRVIEVTGAERGFLLLRDEETELFEFKVARNIEKQDLETPKFEISRTIVNQVVETGEALLTDNAQDTFSEQQSVIMMALRSILCVPIWVKDRMTGLVYVDNRIHIGAFNETHLELVTAFASQAGISIENARLYQIAIEQGRMQRELEMAHGIQRGLLPGQPKTLSNYDVSVYWDSAQEVAGDFYDCFLIQNDQAMGSVIADVSGKGAPAAIFMAVARSLIRGNAVASLSPEDMLRHANRLIMEDAGTSGMFVTVYYAEFFPDGRMVGVNAGHNVPLLWRAKDGSVEWLPKGGRALGWFPDLPVEPYELQLEVGDVIVLYTDGVTEAENQKREPFGDQRLAAVVQETAPYEFSEGIKQGIIAAVDGFVGDMPPFDDRTFLIVRYEG